MVASGIFFPRLTAGLGVTILGGRELYRIGYMSKDGPTSKIRELGAVPLNIAELFLVLSLSFVFLRYQTGFFLGNRKSIRYLTKSAY